MRAIAVDVGGTTMKITVVSTSGELGLRRTVATPKDPKELVSVIAAEVRKLRQEAKENGFDDVIDQIGVVIPGIVDEGTGVAVLSANLGWQDVMMRKMLQEALGVPVSFGHDVRAGALAEKLWGAGRGSANMFYVAVGTGIGGALVFGTQPFSGSGWAGEIGQTVVRDPDAGKSERLERVASAAAIARRYLERSTLPRTEAEKSALGAKDVYMAYAQGEEAARYVVDSAHICLADALAAAVCLLGSVRLVIGGGLAAGPKQEFIDPLTALLKQRLLVHPCPEVVKAHLGSWSQSLGAGAMALLDAGYSIE